MGMRYLIKETEAVGGGTLRYVEFCDGRIYDKTDFENEKKIRQNHLKGLTFQEEKAFFEKYDRSDNEGLADFDSIDWDNWDADKVWDALWDSNPLVGNA